MKLRKMSLALVLSLGIGSLGIASASANMFQNNSTVPVHREERPLSAMSKKAGQAIAVSTAMTLAGNSTDKVRVKPAANTKPINNQSAVDSRTQMSTNHYVYMEKNMANIEQHMNLDMEQHMNSDMGQHMASDMGQYMSSGMGQYMSSEVGKNMSSEVRTHMSSRMMK